MKQLIIFLSMLMLGCALFELIAGDENSVYTNVQGVWQHELETGKVYP